MVDEKTIDETIDRLADETEFKKASETLIHDQPGLVAYLESESFRILIPAEMDVLWYSLIVILESADVDYLLEIQDIEAAEEKNYGRISDSMSFDRIADEYFKAYEEEDLLAFAEDTLIYDPEADIEDVLTPIGRKVIFVTLKTVIDLV